MSHGKKHKNTHANAQDNIEPPVMASPATHDQAPTAGCHKGNTHNDHHPSDKLHDPNWWIVWLTGFLGVAAFLTFGALWVQLQDARNNFVKDQRPYIWKSNVQLPTIALSQKVHWNFYFNNFGKSLAIGVEERCQIRLSAHDTPERRDMYAPTHTRGYEYEGLVIPPGDSSNWSTCQSEEVVTERDLDTTNTFEVGIKLLVFFEYYDTSGNQYSSTVCMFMTKPSQGAIQVCPAENRIK